MFTGEDEPKEIFAPDWERNLHRQQQRGRIRHPQRTDWPELEGVWENPIQNCFIQNWGDMEKVWRHAFNRLGVHHEDCAGVLCTEPPNNPKEHREAITQMMFETFDTRSFYLALSATLAMFATGRTTGLVVDCGRSATHLVPVYEGYAMPHAVQRTLGGDDLTQYLNKVMNETSGWPSLQNSCSLDTAEIGDAANTIKEELCYMANDFSAELSAFRSDGKQQQFEFPDGTAVTVEDQMIRCPELLLRPSLDGKENMGLHEVISQQVIDECDIEIRNDLYANIILAGGTASFPNLTERLQAEVQALRGEHATVKVINPPERLLFGWCGGSILASMSTYRGTKISRTQYDEMGPRIVHNVGL